MWGGVNLKFNFITEKLHSNKKNQDFYAVKLALTDKDNKILQKSQVIMWLSKEQYESLNSQK